MVLRQILRQPGYGDQDHPDVQRDDPPRPDEPREGSEPIVSAWDAVASTQADGRFPCWFVTQPDHAHVSGQVAAAFHPVQFPELSADAVEAIRLHDQGWECFDGCSPNPLPATATEDGRALSFMAVAPHQYLNAWKGSIARAEQVSELAGILVSRHFQALGKFGVAKLDGQPSDQQKVRQFLEEEGQRERRLLSLSTVGPPVLTRLLAVLQFCDLLSLYLCCNSSQPIEFPQDFGSGKVRLRREDSRFVLSPTPLAAPLSVSFPSFLAELDHTVCESRAVEAQLI